MSEKYRIVSARLKNWDYALSSAYPNKFCRMHLNVSVSN